MNLTLNLNGADHKIDVDGSTPLLYVLRNHLGLNGAKFGCGLTQCGACTVQVDSDAVFSCVMPVAALQGRRIRTVEGLGTAEKPGLLQEAFDIEQAAQCGYCTAGMIMRAQALLDGTPSPSEAAIRAHMQTNLCRCGTHLRIIRAIHRASAVLKSGTVGQESPL
jgi:nicotinate dehydrogenase subunit A